MEDITEKLKEIERREAELARERKSLIEEQERRSALQAQLDKLVESSGFGSPKALVDALIQYYGLKMVQRRKVIQSTAASGGERRRRTKITPELRDEIKGKLNAGHSKNSISAETGISYAVITKIASGAYEKL